VKVGDIVVALEEGPVWDEGSAGLLICVDKGQPDKEYTPWYFVQWNHCPNRDPYEYELQRKHIEVLYSS
jgi:hypothetical protein